MASNLEEEVKVLKEKNNELVQKVQYWKMAAAQREEEKLLLMKDINDLRLKLNHVKNSSKVHSMKLESTLQTGNEKALALLVRASGEIANIMKITKGYLRDMQELDDLAPRWSAIGGTPSSDKHERVHRVPPTLVGGRSIQPVVSLSRTLLNSSSSISRGPNQSRSTERAVPIHMLQDVYIPLTRIDADMHGNNVEVEEDANDDELENSTADLELEDDAAMSDTEQYEASPQLDVVAEDVEEEEEEVPIPPRRCGLDNGLEGPSWLLDPASDRPSVSNYRRKEEPDSTTGANEITRDVSNAEMAQTSMGEEPAGAGISVRVSCAFSPAVRRHPSSPAPPVTPHSAHFSPRLSTSRRNSLSNRVLKVMVTKMRLNDEDNNDVTPSKRPKPDRLMSFDAPSPSGATDAGVIVLDTSEIKPPMESPCYVTVRNRRNRNKRNERTDHENDLDVNLDRNEHNNSDHNVSVERNVRRKRKEKHSQNELTEHTSESEYSHNEQVHGEDQGERLQHGDENELSNKINYRDLSIEPNESENTSKESRKERHKRREDHNRKQKECASGFNVQASTSRSDRNNRRIERKEKQNADRTKQSKHIDLDNRNNSNHLELSTSTEHNDDSSNHDQHLQRNNSGDRAQQNENRDQDNKGKSSQALKYDRRERSDHGNRNAHKDQNSCEQSDDGDHEGQNSSSSEQSGKSQHHVHDQTIKEEHRSHSGRRESKKIEKRVRKNFKDENGLDEQQNRHQNRDENSIEPSERGSGNESRGCSDQHDRSDYACDLAKRSDHRFDRSGHSNGFEDINIRDRRNQYIQTSKDSSDSESVSESANEGRTRRARKAVTYKEKPLNRKMRR